MKVIFIFVIIAEIIVLRIFWVGALKRIDERVDDLMEKYLVSISEVVWNAIKSH